MNKYRFARFYMKILILAAVVAVIGGMAFSIQEVLASINKEQELQKLQTATVTLDTITVSHEMRSVFDLICQSLADSNRKAPVFPAPSGFPSHPSATLTAEDLRAYLSYLQNCRRCVASLKESFLFSFDESMSSMIKAADKALPASINARQNTPAASGATMAYERLYRKDALLPAHVESMQAVAFFLKDRISFYTPSPEARDLADKANRNVEKILSVMLREVEIGGQGFSIPTEGSPQEEPATTAIASSSSKTQLVMEFIGLLKKCRETTTSVALTNWKIDQVLDNAFREAERQQAQNQTRLTAVQAETSRHLRMAGIIFVSSLIAAILFLAFYDFMLALIDTAINTHRMARILAGDKSSSPDNSFEGS